MIIQPLDFENLVGAIHQVHAELATQANRAVNVQPDAAQLDHRVNTALIDFYVCVCENVTIVQ